MQTRQLLGFGLAAIATASFGCGETATRGMVQPPAQDEIPADAAAPQLDAPAAATIAHRNNLRDTRLPRDLARPEMIGVGLGVLPSVGDVDDPVIDDPIDDPDPIDPGELIEPGAVYQRGQLRTTFGENAASEILAEDLYRDGEMRYRFKGFRVLDSEGNEVRFLDAEEVAGYDEGDILRFADVLPSTDLTYVPGVHRMRQVLVLYSLDGVLDALDAGGTLEIVEEVEVPSAYHLLEVHETAGGEVRNSHHFPTRIETAGSLSFVETLQSERLVLHFTIPAPLAIEDSELLAESESAAQRFQLTHALEVDEHGAGEYITRISADQLLDEDVIFPVYIDPDLHLAQGVVVSAVHVAPTNSQSCDVRASMVYGNFVNKPLNLNMEWDDGPTESLISAQPQVRTRAFDAADCPGDYEFTFEVCDDKVPPECDTVTLDAHPGHTTALPQNHCDNRCYDGVSRAFSASGYEECARRMAEACADHLGHLETSPASSNLIINEVRFDQPGADGSLTFVELFGPAGMSLQGWQLEHRSGTTGEVVSGAQGWLDLSGQVPANGHYVICSPGSTVSSCDIEAAIGNGQNGNGSAYILRYYGLRRDAVQYKNDGAKDTHAAEGNPAPGAADTRSLSRNLAHDDTNDNATDFSSTPPSPGVNGAP